MWVCAVATFDWTCSTVVASQLGPNQRQALPLESGHQPMQRHHKLLFLTWQEAIFPTFNPILWQSSCKTWRPLNQDGSLAKLLQPSLWIKGNLLCCWNSFLLFDCQIISGLLFVLDAKYFPQFECIYKVIIPCYSSRDIRTRANLGSFEILSIVLKATRTTCFTFKSFKYTQLNATFYHCNMGQQFLKKSQAQPYVSADILQYPLIAQFS